jgi:hypothetical protein
MRIVLAVAALAASLVAGGAQASERSTLEAKLRKYTGTLTRRGAVCVCQNGGQFHSHAGYVSADDVAPDPGLVAVRSVCAIPIFSEPGNLIGYSSCHPYVALAK